MPYSSTDPNAESHAEKLRDVVAGWIDMVATQGERAIDAVGLRFPGKPWVPSVDIVEGPEQVVVRFDLPGMDPEKVEVLLVGNMLTIKGESPTAPLQQGESRHRHERPSGAFSRSIPLPIAVDPDHVAAESKHGVLTVTLAKAERAKARQIQIDVKTSNS
jgi:HSP20 family protein